MRARTMIAAVAGGLLAMTSIGRADEFLYAEVIDVSDEVGTPEGLVTWRVVANFDEIVLLLSVSGGEPEGYPVLVFETNDPQGLVNDGGPFAGLKQEDFAGFPLTAQYDSFVTIDHLQFAGNCTDYSPGFLDNDGITSVIVDGMTTFFSTDQGWFLSHPTGGQSGPATPIAQFTVRAGFGVRLSGTLFFQFSPGMLEREPFCATSLDFDSICECLPDIDGDGATGFGDLLAVLSSWGDCAADACCREDLDFDGFVNFADLLIILSNWGPCPTPGACCFADGTCAPARCLDGVDCTASGGVFLGPETVCGQDECPPPAACCFADGTCAAQYEAQCLASGGTPQGPNTLCEAPLCPQPGACCLTTGQCNQAMFIDGSICEASGGTYFGPDTLCADVVCVQPGACCRTNGTCSLAMQVGGIDCMATGGVYLGDDTTCDGVVCPAPGACCFPDGTCAQAAQVGGNDCIAAGGLYLGVDTLCADVSCIAESCCLPDGACVRLYADDCLADGGVPQGEGTLCGDVVCPQPGACCYPDTTCAIDPAVGGAACIAAGGVYEGDDTTCLDSECDAPGACCFADFSCALVLEDVCAAQGGSFVGEGTDCGVNCSRGACCLPDGSCFFVEEATCDLLGGTFEGNGVPCASVECP